jgi:transposase
LVPQDHFYRHLERTLDLSFVREFVHKTYAQGGRPSIDPIVFFKLQLVMFFEGIRSERQLMRHAADRLSVRWFLGYDLNEPLPNHSSLSRIRELYGVEVFRRFFEAVVDQCQQVGLVWGKELYVDATKVEANASMDSVKPRFAVEAHLSTLFDMQAEEPGDEEEQQQVQDELAGSDASLPLPVPLSSRAYEELAQRNEARHDWIQQGGKPDREIRRGTYRRMADFVVSTTDPDATVMPIKGQGRHLGYHTHYVVDGGKARIIMAVLVTPSEVMENQPMLDLVWRTRFRWKLWPRQVTGDTTYGTVDNIMALEHEHIRAYMPLPDFDQRTAFYGQREFQYDPKQDTIAAPMEPQCASKPTSLPSASNATAQMRPPAMPAPSNPTAPQACMDASSSVALTGLLWIESERTMRLRLTKRRCASGRSGSNPCLPKAKTGMGCAVLACGGYGV